MSDTAGCSPPGAVDETLRSLTKVLESFVPEQVPWDWYRQASERGLATGEKGMRSFLILETSLPYWEMLKLCLTMFNVSGDDVRKNENV